MMFILYADVSERKLVTKSVIFTNPSPHFFIRSSETNRPFGERNIVLGSQTLQQGRNAEYIKTR